MPVVADQNTIFLSEKYIYLQNVSSLEKMKKTENFLSEYWCCVSLIAKLVMANRLHLEEQFGWEQCARQAPYCKLFKVTNNRAKGLRIENYLPTICVKILLLHGKHICSTNLF